MSRTITFSAGDNQIFISVDTLDDDSLELAESFTVLLSNPSEGLDIGDQDLARVNIRDNEGSLLI